MGRPERRENVLCPCSSRSAPRAFTRRVALDDCARVPVPLGGTPPEVAALLVVGGRFTNRRSRDAPASPGCTTCASLRARRHPAGAQYGLDPCTVHAHHGIGARTSLECPVKSPLDVTVLVAWGWSDHVAHEPTVTWIAATSERKASTLLTSATPELGFVRVSVQRTGGHVAVKAAGRTLAGRADAAPDECSGTVPTGC